MTTPRVYVGTPSQRAEEFARWALDRLDGALVADRDGNDKQADIDLRVGIVEALLAVEARLQEVADNLSAIEENGRAR